jgi:hypothetical protein
MDKLNTRPADHRVTLRQIGTMTLMSCGARDYVRDDENGTLWFRVGSGASTRGKVCKVTVRLMATDTYRVEYGYMVNRKGPDWGTWVDVDVEDDVYAEDLSTVVRRLGDRERY